MPPLVQKCSDKQVFQWTSCIIFGASIPWQLGGRVCASPVAILIMIVSELVRIGNHAVVTVHWDDEETGVSS
jgi:hypothetical protein